LKVNKTFSVQRAILQDEMNENLDKIIDRKVFVCILDEDKVNDKNMSLQTSN